MMVARQQLEALTVVGSSVEHSDVVHLAVAAIA